MDSCAAFPLHNDEQGYVGTE